MTALERRCPGGHEHVKIEGRLTKPSAVYVPALAQNFGRAFEAALRRKRSKEESEPDVRGVESVLANDLLVSGDWELEFACIGEGLRILMYWRAVHMFPF